jgi:aminopeptidase N
VAIGLIGKDGKEVQETTILELSGPDQRIRFEGLGERPVASILRGFSAPVVLKHDLSDADRAHLLAYDTDPFNRWEQGRLLAQKSLIAMINDGVRPDVDYLGGIHKVVTDTSLDPAYRALMLVLPGEAELATALHAAGKIPDPAAIHEARESMSEVRAAFFADDAPGIYQANTVTDPYQPSADQCGRRVLANSMLALITRRDGGAQALIQYDAADNMNQQSTALALLIGAGKGDEKVAAFEKQWKHDRLVMDKWFSLQVMKAKPEDAAATALRLTSHPDFNHKNPNRFRAVFGALAMHHAGFHHASGDAYALLADWLITLDPLNPQTTARMCSAFQTWKRYDKDRQTRMLGEIDRILATPKLSRDVTEMLTRIRSD